MLEQVGTNTWNEMSYKRYENRNEERELDIFELEEIKNKENNYDKENVKVYYYGTFEDITKKNCFGVDELFYLNYEE